MPQINQADTIMSIYAGNKKSGKLIYTIKCVYRPY